MTLVRAPRPWRRRRRRAGAEFWSSIAASACFSGSSTQRAHRPADRRWTSSVHHLRRVVVRQVDERRARAGGRAVPGREQQGSRASPASRAARSSVPRPPRAPRRRSHRLAGSDTCSPASALNSDDLPLPVAPASADDDLRSPDSRRALSGAPRRPPRPGRAGRRRDDHGRARPSAGPGRAAGPQIIFTASAMFSARPRQERHRPPRPQRQPLQRLGVTRVGGVRGGRGVEPDSLGGEQASTRSRRSARPASASRRTASSPNSASSSSRPRRSFRPRPRPWRRWGWNATPGGGTEIMTIGTIAFTPYAAIQAVVRREAPSRRTRSSTAPCRSRTM